MNEEGFNVAIQKTKKFSLLKLAPARPYMNLFNCGVCDSRNDINILEHRYNHSTGKLSAIYICKKCCSIICDCILHSSASAQVEASVEYYNNLIDKEDIENKIFECKKLMLSLQHYIKNINGKTFLDYGCGAGLMAIAAAELGFPHVYGVDWNIETCKKTLEKYPSATNIEFYTDVKSISSKVDVVLLWHVLEHISRPYSFLKELGEHLKKGSKIFIQIPQYDSRHIVNTHYYFFNEPSIYYLFNRLDLNIIDIMYDSELAFMTIILEK